MATRSHTRPVREWQFRFAPLLASRLRAARRGRAGESWYLDETHLKVAGRWCHLHRAIDRHGGLIDSMLSRHRDKHAARSFLRRLVAVADRKPLRVTTEQSHRAVKQRYYPMLGCGRFDSASRFCLAFDELRRYSRVRRRGDGRVSLAEQRRRFLTHWRSLTSELAAAWSGRQREPASPASSAP